MDGVKFGKIGKWENSKIDEETCRRSEEKLCRAIMKGLARRNCEKHAMLADMEETQEDRVSGLTHGDDFVLTGPTEKLIEIERKMINVYPIKAKIISYWSSKSIKTINRWLHWGERGIIYQHDPRHVDVLVNDHGLEHVNSVQTPAAPDVIEEGKIRTTEPRSAPQVQITGCKMLVSQSRSSRHNIYCA